MSQSPLHLVDDPGALALAEKLRRLSGRPIAMRLTPDGEAVVMGMEGALVDMPLEVDELGPLPPKLGARHDDVMGIVYTAVQQIKERGRTVPLTRSELLGEFQADYRAVDDLEEWGFLKQRPIEVLDTRKARKRGTRIVYYFTPKGRAYVREKFDPGYALPPAAAPGPGGVPGGVLPGGRAAGTPPDPRDGGAGDGAPPGDR